MGHSPRLWLTPLAFPFPFADANSTPLLSPSSSPSSSPLSPLSSSEEPPSELDSSTASAGVPGGSTKATDLVPQRRLSTNQYLRLIATISATWSRCNLSQSPEQGLLNRGYSRPSSFPRLRPERPLEPDRLVERSIHLTRV